MLFRSSRRPLHWWLAMDSNHPRRLYESRVLPTELASRYYPRNLAGRAGFEPAHAVINSHVPFQLGYRPKTRRPRFWSGPSRIASELGNLTNGQTNPEGPARLTRRLIMDLVLIVILETEYSTSSVWPSGHNHRWIDSACTPPVECQPA